MRKLYRTVLGLGVGVVACIGAAQAALITVEEPQRVGSGADHNTTLLPTLPGTDPMAMYSDGSFDADDEIIYYAAINSGLDYLHITTTTAFEFILTDLVFPSYADAGQKLSVSLFDDGGVQIGSNVLYGSGDALGSVFGVLTPGTYSFLVKLTGGIFETSYDFDVKSVDAAVPLPGALGLMALGLAGGAFLKRRRAA